MHDSPDPQTPNAVVARRIVDRFVDEGLLPRPFADRLLSQLAAGALRADDWQALARQALTWEEENEKEADDDLW
jgi:hypothetical protein